MRLTLQIFKNVVLEKIKIIKNAGALNSDEKTVNKRRL